MGGDEGTIGSGTGFMMIAVALIIDGLEAVLSFFLIGLLVNSFIDLIAALIFGIWFSHHGVRSGLGIAGTAAVEFIPGLNALPVWTGYIVYKVFSSRAAPSTES